MNHFAPVLESQQQAGLIAVDGRTYPLKEVRLQARAHAGMAGSTLVQRFANPCHETLEVRYSLALPADGAVVGYRMRLGETLITGRIETREQAEEEYRNALAEGRLGGLMEQERPDTFTQWLGNIPGGMEVEVEIDVTHPLLFVAGGESTPGRWQYRFPTVPGVRYLGEKGRIPDADRVTVDRSNGPIPVRLNLDLALGDGAPERLAPASPSHEIMVDPAGQSESVVRLVESARLDRDVVVEWRATAGEVGATLAIGRGLPGDDGYYGLLSLTPPEIPVEAIPRDLILLLDCSGSMHGAPIGAVRKIAREVIQSLGPQDSFELIAFADRPTRFAARPSGGTPGEIDQAIRWIDRLQAGGCTEMADAIMEALGPIRPDAQRQVLLMTDGFIGFEDEVVGRIARTLPASCRVHAVGVGSAPNRSLTRAVARCGRGLEVFASGPEAAGIAAGRLLASTVAPVLTGVEVTGSAVLNTAPRRMPDLYKGRPGLVALELNPEGGEIQIRGRLGRTDEWNRTISVPPAMAVPESATQDSGARGRDDAHGGIRPDAHPAALYPGALFGRETLEDLEADLAAGLLPRQEADRGIEACGLRHRIPSRRTSLVAVSENRVTDPGRPRRLVRPAQELPYGVSAEGVGLAWPGKPAGMSPVYGEAEGILRMSIPSSQILYSIGIDADEDLSSPHAHRRRTRPRPPFPVPAQARTRRDLLILEITLDSEDLDAVVQWQDEMAMLHPDPSVRSESTDPCEALRELHNTLAAGGGVRVIIGGEAVRAVPQPASPEDVEETDDAYRIRLVLRTADGSDWPSTAAGRAVWRRLGVRIAFEPQVARHPERDS